MLVLSRKLREDILIPQLGITITPVECRKRDSGDYVRIAIDAPQHITIYRREIWDEMRRNGEVAVWEKMPKNGEAHPSRFPCEEPAASATEPVTSEDMLRATLKAVAVMAQYYCTCSKPLPHPPRCKFCDIRELAEDSL